MANWNEVVFQWRNAFIRYRAEYTITFIKSLKQHRQRSDSAHRGRDGPFSAIAHDVIDDDADRLAPRAAPQRSRNHQRLGMETIWALSAIYKMKINYMETCLFCQRQARETDSVHDASYLTPGAYKYLSSASQGMFR